tara:strand:- start:134 stop:901 length:768 start_codon:yes stop_codon:yes gene_type:complete
MIINKEADIIFTKWFLFFIGLLVVIFLLSKYNLITSLLKNDISFISPLILIIFSFFTIIVGRHLFIIRNVANIYNTLKLSINSNDPLAPQLLKQLNNSKCFISYSIYSYFFSTYRISLGTNTTTEGKLHELNEQLEYKLSKNIDAGWFVVDLLLKLGLIGTVIGFIIMLASITIIENFDLSMMQDLLQKMSTGMMVALYTTLTGLITSMLLSFQYKYLESIIFDLILDVTEYNERYHSNICKIISSELKHANEKN